MKLPNRVGSNFRSVHRVYQALGRKVGKLVDTKNAAYGSSFDKAGSILRILYPEGVPLDKLDDALAIVRILDKLFRIANMPKSGDSMGEDPWKDVAGYGLLALNRTARKERKR